MMQLYSEKSRCQVVNLERATNRSAFVVLQPSTAPHGSHLRENIDRPSAAFLPLQRCPAVGPARDENQ